MPFLKLSSGTEMHYMIPTYVDKSKKEPIDPSRPTLFFVHAPCVDGRSWHHQVEDAEMNQNFNMVSVDLPFCGLTRTPKDWQAGRKANLPGVDGKLPTGRPNISFEQQAEDLAEAIKKLKLPVVHLVGLGVNTHICYTLLLRYPKLFKSATFLSPATLAESDEGKANFNDIWSSMVDGCPEELEEATAGFYSIFFGVWALRDPVRRERWTKMWACALPNLEIRRYVFGDWATGIITRAPITVEQVKKGFTVPILVCSGTDHMIHPTAHAELDEIFQSGQETACPYYETHHLGNAPLMLAKTNYEEINNILGHFVCNVEGTELKAPRAKVKGYEEDWQEPYTALERRLEMIQSGQYQAEPVSKKAPWKMGIRNLVQALNTSSN